MRCPGKLRCNVALQTHSKVEFLKLVCPREARFRAFCAWCVRGHLVVSGCSAVEPNAPMSCTLVRWRCVCNFHSGSMQTAAFPSCCTHFPNIGALMQVMQAAFRPRFTAKIAIPGMHRRIAPGRKLRAEPPLNVLKRGRVPSHIAATGMLRRCKVVEILGPRYWLPAATKPLRIRQWVRVRTQAELGTWYPLMPVEATGRIREHAPGHDAGWRSCCRCV